MLICLIAGALAAFGGRWWRLAAAIAARPPRRDSLIALGASVAIAAPLAALLGAAIHAQLRGPGMVLFLALALLLAGGTMLWPARTLPARLVASARGPVSATILLLAALAGDGAPFIILAAAALTGAPILAALGGGAGLLAAGAAAAAGADMLPPRTVTRIRLAGGILLSIAGAIVALGALGLR